VAYSASQKYQLADRQADGMIWGMKSLFMFLMVGAFCGSMSAQLAQSVVVGGVTREYYLHVPEGTKTPMALVIALHGGGGNGMQMARSTSFAELADREKFIVAFPNGINHQWNDGRSEVGSTSDDVGFMRAIIADIEKHARVDEKRIFATGMSNGAAMASRLGCEMSETIRGIGPVSNTMKVDAVETCHPTRAVGVIEFHGTADSIVPYDGGEIVVLGRRRGKVIGTKEYSEFWAKQNGCDAKPVATALPDIAHDGTVVTKMEFQHCKRAPVIFYSIAGGGHAWPSGAERKFRLVPSVESHQVDATALIWEFFKNLH